MHRFRPVRHTPTMTIGGPEGIPLPSPDRRLRLGESLAYARQAHEGRMHEGMSMIPGGRRNHPSAGVDCGTLSGRPASLPANNRFLSPSATLLSARPAASSFRYHSAQEQARTHNDTASSAGGQCAASEPGMPMFRRDWPIAAEYRYDGWPNSPQILTAPDCREDRQELVIPTRGILRVGLAPSIALYPAGGWSRMIYSISRNRGPALPVGIAGLSLACCEVWRCRRLLLLIFSGVNSRISQPGSFRNSFRNIVEERWVGG